MSAQEMKLAKYTVESNSLVTLLYKNGSSKKVRIANLEKHVNAEDAERIRQSVSVRKTFFKDLPKWAKAIAIPIAVIVIGLTAAKASPGIDHLIHHQQPASVPARQETTAIAPEAEPVTVPVEDPDPTPEPATKPAKATQPKPLPNTNEPFKHVTDFAASVLSGLTTKHD